MRRPICRILVLVALSLMLTGVLSPASSAVPASPLAYRFHGLVTDGEGQGIAGATVSDGDRATTTDAEGRYTLDEQLPGTYTLRASAPCYRSMSKQVTVLLPADREVDFQLESTC